MATWDERVRSSEAWVGAEALQAAVAELSVRNAGNTALERARFLAQTGIARLRALDPNLAFAELLANLGIRFQALEAALRQHLEPNDAEPGVDQGALEASEDSLAQAVLWLPPNDDGERVAVLDGYRQDAAGLREQVTTWVDQARSETESAAASQAEQLATRDQQASALEARLTDLEGSVTALAEEATSFIASRTVAADATDAAAKERLDAQLARIAASFEEAQTAANAAHTAMLTAHETAHTEALTAASEQTDSVVQDIEDLKAKAERLVGAVGRTGLSGGYQQWEKAERTQANVLRGVAILFGCLTALSILFLLAEKADKVDKGREVEISLVVGGLAVPAALGGVATYAGKEASKHRRNAVVARRTELELASFGAYMADLPEPDQQRLIQVFAPVFFGQANSTPAEGDGDDGPQTLSAHVLSRIMAFTGEKSTN